ncbi:uncharacterized Fe-S center protein [Halobacteroides halobius DSM 5150]|uniref:Uncharacterized Fe-S center protein n=1 Tax=Halobacteroides halobius (strain ATCC 35273 / DSM 5150 / MD-1) TaxID=748449 RepID=L0K736_HALHC|nr:DUF362 domain-containing protein [Halobacteroides halobius]AGB40340.1 uncharacterized Fe-S center protein [Halobacteroides halobius DSM 5150]
MTSDVYYSNMRTRDKKNNLVNKLSRLFKKAGFEGMIDKDDLWAIKIHFGEKGGNAFIRPMFARRMVKEIKEQAGSPFLTDANTLYSGARSNAVDHLNTAIANGFGYSTVLAPLVIADGLNGKNFTEVEIDGEHFDFVKIGSEAMQADGMISMAHFKGHELTGFGGAIKNVGMGLGSRSGKQMMHTVVEPQVNIEDCIACGKCAEWCAHDAIVVEEFSEINLDECVGCGECLVSCPVNVISTAGKKDAPVGVQERMAEFTLGAIKGKEEKMGYINFVMDVSPLCDCTPWSDQPIVSDIGILASKDPVALDQACADLVNQQPGNKHSALECNYEPGEDKFRGVHPDVDWEAQLVHGEKIGLGTREYNLIEV